MASYTGLFGATPIAPMDRLGAASRAIAEGNYAGSSGYWVDGSNGLNANGMRPGDSARSAIDARFGVSSPNMGYQSFAQPTSGLGFTTLNNVKSPAFQGPIDSYLQQINGTGYNPNVNPNVVRSNVKNPALEGLLGQFSSNIGGYTNPTDFTKSGQFQSGINAGYGTQANDSATNRNTFSDYANLFKTQTPDVLSNASQENNAISRTYNGGLASDLQNNADAQARAVNLSANRALGTVGRNNSLLRLAGGDSSYATQQALDTAAGIYAQAANQKAQLGRENLTYMQGQQAGLDNVRNQNLGYVANRGLQPIGALTSLTNNEQGQLGQLGSMDLSNNVYTTPQQQGQSRLEYLNSLSAASNNNNFYNLDSQQSNLGRQLSLFGQAQQSNNANNFYGLQAPYTPNTSGYGYAPPVTSAGGRGNYGAPPYNLPGYGNYSGPPAVSAAAQGNANGLPDYMQGPAYQQGTPQFYAGAAALSAQNYALNSLPPAYNPTGYQGYGGMSSGGQWYGATPSGLPTQSGAYAGGQYFPAGPTNFDVQGAY